jgi:thiol-disulfide isomerase/thioredoxin
VTTAVQWTSSNNGVLVPSATDKGYLVTFGEGTAQITATLDGKTVTGDYTVTPPRIEYVLISPQDARIEAATPLQYRATGHWSDSRVEDITARVTWSSSNPAVATIDAAGLATAVGDGDTVITARIDDVEARATARTVTSACPYPMDASTQVVYDSILPPVFWLNAIDETGAMSDFQVSDLYCQASEHPTIVFALSAGWCPYCPAYMAMVDSITPELEAAGAIVVYVVTETGSGLPANNGQAHTLIEGETEGLGHSIRVGDGETAGAIARPFANAVTAMPSAFVVRTRDMRVIASQDRSDSYLDFVQIVNNPERLY